jgi:hypothetical protein
MYTSLNLLVFLSETDPMFRGTTYIIIPSTRRLHEYTEC